MNTERIKKLLEIIDSAAMVVVGDSPYLHSVNVEEITGEINNVVLWANWHDAEGNEYREDFTELNLDEATTVGNEVILKNIDGEDIRIFLFELTQLEIDL